MTLPRLFPQIIRNKRERWEQDWQFRKRQCRGPRCVVVRGRYSPRFWTPLNRASEPSPLAWKRRDSDTTGRPAPVPRVAIAKSWFSTFAFLPRRFQNLQNTVEDVFVRRRETGFSIKNKKTIDHSQHNRTLNRAWTKECWCSPILLYV